MLSTYKKAANIDDEYRKNPDLRREDVQQLLKWSEKQPHLPKISELEAILFLQSCYSRNEVAKTALDTYFTVKTMCTDLFGVRNPLMPPMKDFLPVVLYTPLPKLTPDGYQVFFCKVMNGNPDMYHFNLALRYFDMSAILHLYEKGTARGHLIVFDMDSVVFGHLTRLSPVLIKKMLYYLQEAMPVRLKGIHYFNVVSFIDKIMAMIRPFLKKELMDSFCLHKNLEGLLPFVPLECLPKDYGGALDSIQTLHDKEMQRLVDSAAFFQLEDARPKVDESKRPGKPKNITEFFGVEGTFKKLDID